MTKHPWKQQKSSFFSLFYLQRRLQLAVVRPLAAVWSATTDPVLNFSCDVPAAVFADARRAEGSLQNSAASGFRTIKPEQKEQ